MIVPVFTTMGIHAAYTKKENDDKVKAAAETLKIYFWGIGLTTAFDFVIDGAHKAFEYFTAPSDSPSDDPLACGSESNEVNYDHDIAGHHSV